MLGPLELYMMPTLDAALLCSSRAGSNLGRKSDKFEKLFKYQSFNLSFLTSQCLSFSISKN